MVPRATYRLLITSATSGELNMAMDDALLASVARDEAWPTLRFFDWSPPCLSLGHAQALEDVDRQRLETFGYGLVRRPTGGKAILHIDEITYSLVTPQDDPRVAGGIMESYQHLSQGLMRGLELLGLIARNDKTYLTAENAESAKKEKEQAICFEVPSNYEITVSGKKLMGSAQARKQGMVLQHGSLPLQGDIARICDVLSFADEAARGQAKERVRSRAITLEGALGQIIPYHTAAQALAQGFAETLNIELVEGELTEKEKTEAEELRERKYRLENKPAP